MQEKKLWIPIINQLCISFLIVDSFSQKNLFLTKIFHIVLLLGVEHNKNFLSFSRSGFSMSTKTYDIEIYFLSRFIRRFKDPQRTLNN